MARAAAVAVVTKPTIARGDAAIDLLTSANEARKRAKQDRQRMADALVDLLLENAELRHALDEARQCAR